MYQIFPQSHTKPKEIYTDGLKALEQNLVEYKRITKFENTKTRFSIKGVNSYNGRLRRLNDLSFNEALAEQDEKNLRAAEARILDLKDLQEAKQLSKELNNSANIDDAVFKQLDKLLVQPGYAAKINEYVSRASGKEVAGWQAKINRMQTIVDRLDVTRKQKNLEEATARAVTLATRVEDLQGELNDTKNEYYTLKEQYFEVQNEVSRGANTSSADVDRLTNYSKQLETTIATDRAQAERAIAKLERWSELEVNRLRTQLETVLSELKTFRKEAVTDKDEYREENRKLKLDLALAQSDHQKLSLQRNDLRDILNTERTHFRDAQADLAKMITLKSDAEQERKLLQEIIANHKDGKSIDEAELDVARNEADSQKQKCTDVRKEKEKLEEHLYLYKELINRYNFGIQSDLDLDYKKAVEILKVTPMVVRQNVERAVNGLNPFLIGLPSVEPLTGLQLWVEATIRPEQFTSMKLLAYLTNPAYLTRPGGFDDIGFLWLTVDALLDTPQGSLKGFRALAVLDILQTWVRLDLSQVGQVEKRLEEYSLFKSPTIILTSPKTQPFDAFVEIVHRCVQGIVLPAEGSVPNPGQDMLKNVISFECLRSYSIPMDQIAEDTDGKTTTRSGFLVALRSDPAYFVYVENGRIAWIRPENITARVEALAAALYIHDNLTQHLFSAKKIALEGLDSENVCEILRGATWLD